MDNLFTQLHQQYSERINASLANCMVNVDSSRLKDAMTYSLLAGGKRIRPFLVYATGLMFNCKIDLLDAPATAIEAIHTYSLIHDDLPAMDNDELRRGLPTCHIKYDEATAILAGDALQSLGYALIANAPKLSNPSKVLMLKELANASGALGMCLGQSLDLLAENKKISIEELNQIHSYKTGALIKTSVRLGMFAAGSKAIQFKSELDLYAHSIGLAFQIQDDILDVIGDKNIMGKNNGADTKLAKNTYTSLIGVESSIKTCQLLYKQAIEVLDKIPYNSEVLRQLADFVINRNS